MRAAFISLALFSFATSLATSAFAQAAKPKPPAAAPKSLAIFSFLGQDTETISSMSTINGSACKVSGSKKSCVDYNVPVIAGRPMRWLSLEFYNEKLYDLDGAFGNAAFDDLMNAFTSKYGEPVLRVEKWQAKSGAMFDNDVAIWNFKGGTLKLSRIGVDLNSGIFEFYSIQNAPPASKATVDF